MATSEDAFAHPRSAGCFARFLAGWAREDAEGTAPKLTLVEALRKTSLIPAQILQDSVPQMRDKGRIQVGADADIVVFNATETLTARPGRPIRRPDTTNRPAAPPTSV
ncbi:amidohydrolase family protein [Streptomyces sp. SID685]|uniref:amidohydrolase family protein n=1 Tax=Streptomyces sp. SID685 TaxID=2690322 RepID=UPI00136E8B5F|nr:amidohydrolase family protein [Streptomyces sp. SID685]MYR85564.1 amidohydrolase family protein [Streptomyces sp. SID685]